MDVQTRSIIQQVGLALPSHREMQSLLQSSHSPTETETHVDGEIVRRRIAGRAERAVRKITKQCHQHNESRVGAIHSVGQTNVLWAGQRLIN